MLARTLSTLAGTPINLLIHDLNVRIIHAATGEIIRALTINPERRYHGTGAPIGGPSRPTDHRKTNGPNPKTQVQTVADVALDDNGGGGGI